jgi:predicted MFS family arabinose efflux permease
VGAARVTRARARRHGLRTGPRGTGQGRLGGVSRSAPRRGLPDATATPSPGSRAGVSLVPLLAVASGTAVAGNYFLQPLLALVGADLRADVGTLGAVASVALLGYALGLLLVVPLGDVVDRRPLVVGMLAITTAALAGAALAPSVALLAMAVFLLGLSSVVAQVLVPYAASLATDEARTRVVGTVMAGVLTGILAARVVAGLLGGQLGWRAVFAAAAGATAALAVVLSRRLPAEPHRHRRNGRPDVPYREVLAGVARLARQTPALRLRALYGACGFGVFSAVWTTLAFQLRDAHGLGATAVALVALLGVAGALASPRAGRLADRGHGTVVTGAAYAGLLAAAGLLTLGDGRLAVLLLGLVVMDVAVQAGHLANLGVVYAVAADARSRATTVYMTSVFAGGAVGSLAAATAYAVAGWPGVTAVCAALAGTALAVWLSRLPLPAPGGLDEPYPEAVA